MAEVTPWGVSAVVALMVGGGWNFLQGVVRARKANGRPALETLPPEVDQEAASILILARTRDELARENERIREAWRAERAEWEAERAALRGEIRSLANEMERIKAEHNKELDRLRREHNERYAALLEQVHRLQRRADVTPPRGIDLEGK